jgi:hypothetical protein
MTTANIRLRYYSTTAEGCSAGDVEETVLYFTKRRKILNSQETEGWINDSMETSGQRIVPPLTLDWWAS